VTDNDSVGSGTVLSESKTFTYTVNPINTAPTFDITMADYTVQVDSTYDYAISTVSDVDSSDAHTWTVLQSDGSALPTFMSYSALVLTISPTTND
jgi:hypothetical protein